MHDAVLAPAEASALAAECAALEAMFLADAAGEPGAKLMGGVAANLAGWLNEPFVQAPVVETLVRAEQPLLLREIASECSAPISSVNRVLGRLHRRGFVTRYKLPVQGHPRRYGHQPCILCTATRLLYVYTWADAQSAEGGACSNA